jgi:AcrR family transcriptional regulator
MAADIRTGRVNQKERTRTAIIDATRRLTKRGAEVTMASVAKEALVSEATAYRYFPDLASLLREVIVDVWPSPTEALAKVAHSTDVVERVAHATELLLRDVWAAQSVVRAAMSAAISRPAMAGVRPGRRFGLIDEALAPLNDTWAKHHPAAFEQLKRDLAVVMSAEALFILTDLCGLAPDQAIASATRTARTVTAAAIG